MILGAGNRNPGWQMRCPGSAWNQQEPDQTVELLLKGSSGQDQPQSWSGAEPSDGLYGAPTARSRGNWGQTGQADCFRARTRRVFLPCCVMLIENTHRVFVPGEENKISRIIAIHTFFLAVCWKNKLL